MASKDSRITPQPVRSQAARVLTILAARERGLAEAKRLEAAAHAKAALALEAESTMEDPHG